MKENKKKKEEMKADKKLLKGIGEIAKFATGFQLPPTSVFLLQSFLVVENAMKKGVTYAKLKKEIIKNSK